MSQTLRVDLRPCVGRTVAAGGATLFFDTLFGSRPPNHAERCGLIAANRSKGLMRSFYTVRRKFWSMQWVCDCVG